MCKDNFSKMKVTIIPETRQDLRLCHNRKCFLGKGEDDKKKKILNDIKCTRILVY